MFTRLVIHLSNEEITCLPWRFGRPLQARHFTATDTGFAGLADYLGEWQNVPTRVAVDLIEEDFRVETVPHLGLRDRQVVLERRLGQLYRGTPFRMATLQGREATGRRDDIVLCTAITQTDSLVRCLDALASWRIPVLGVYPAAVLGEPLLRNLRVNAEQLLLVTLLHRDALRISFFQQGRLKFSRISQPVPDEGGAIAAELREEMRRTLQYVGSQAWFQRGSAPVQTLLIANAGEAERFAAIWQETDAPLQVLSPAAIARRLRIGELGPLASATGLMLHLLMHQVPREQLAPRERTRDGRLWYVRSAMFGLSAAIATSAAVLALVDVGEGLRVRDDTSRLLAQLAERQGAIAGAEARLPASALSPDRMSALVRFAQNEVDGIPTLLPFLQDLSRALDGTPLLQLRRISWSISTRNPPLKEDASAPLSAANRTASAGALLGSIQARRFYQDIHVEGDVAADAGATPAGQLRDPAPALAQVNALAAALRRPDRAVLVSRPPYDLDPHHGLGSESLEARGRQTAFMLHLVVAPAP